MYPKPETPDGVGDVFFIYAFNPTANGVTAGNDYAQLFVPIQDGDFILRAWGGAETILTAGNPVSSAGTIQIYDDVMNLTYQLPVSVFQYFETGQSVVPQRLYRNNGFIKFDLTNTSPSFNGVVPTGQLVFFGVRRTGDMASDPAPSVYEYYEKPFFYVIQFVIMNHGTSAGGGSAEQHTIAMTDYDFELRQILGCKSTPGAAGELDVTDESADIVLMVFNSGIAPVWFNVLDAGINTAFNVSVSGTSVTVQLAGNGGGSSITTWAAVSAGINASIDCANLGITALTTAFSGLDAGSYGNVVPASIGSGLVPLNGQGTEFQMTLYDSAWRSRSNVPINIDRWVRFADPAKPQNSWPSPPIMYPVNSVIRFDVLSLIPDPDALPTVTLVFSGVRRIRCGR
jgi:hypothetical protein